MAGVQDLAERGEVLHVHNPVDDEKMLSNPGNNHGISLNWCMEYLLEGKGEIRLEPEDILFLFDSDMFLTIPTELHFQLQGNDIVGHWRDVRLL